MKDRVVVDVEIQKTIEELPNGWDDTHLMGVAVACVYEYQTDRFRVYGARDVRALQERLLKADEVIGFNTWAFDFPAIWGLPKRERVTQLQLKSNDLLRRIWQALGYDPDHFTKETHGGWSLDNVAGGTIGRKKIGYGGDAPRWYQNGEIERVINYCLDDVALERDLSDFIDKYGYVVNGKTGWVVPVESLDI
jgi:DEAD/DEAH box helicase domain-containing protein